MTSDEVIKAARERPGLSDFGDERYRIAVKG